MKLSRRHIARTLLKHLFQGLLIVGPTTLTVMVLWYLVSSIDQSIPYLSEKLYPGITFLVVLSGLITIGYISNKIVFGQRLFSKIDRTLERIPGVRHIYTPTKDVMSSFVGDKKKFNVPVWVRTEENPETWRIGFLTQEHMSGEFDASHCAVYLPHSYAISGWVIIARKEDIRRIHSMSAASAMKFAVSGGVAGFHSDEAVFKAPE